MIEISKTLIAILRRVFNDLYLYVKELSRKTKS